MHRLPKHLRRKAVVASLALRFGLIGTADTAIVSMFLGPILSTAHIPNHARHNHSVQHNANHNGTTKQDQSIQPRILSACASTLPTTGRIAALTTLWQTRDPAPKISIVVELQLQTHQGRAQAKEPSCSMCALFQSLDPPVRPLTDQHQMTAARERRGLDNRANAQLHEESLRRAGGRGARSPQHWFIRRCRPGGKEASRGMEQANGVQTHHEPTMRLGSFAGVKKDILDHVERPKDGEKIGTFGDQGKHH